MLTGIADVLRKILSVVFLLVFVAVIVMLWQGPPEMTVEDNVALVVAPSGMLVEYDDTDPREQLLDEVLGEPPAIMPVAHIIEPIRRAAEDPRIGMLFLKLDEGFAAGQAQLDAIAGAIQHFRASGKPVHAYGIALGQAEYFLAAQADRIAIDPMGAVFLPGFEVDRVYFAEALESLGVDVHVFRRGEYKSAVEPFQRNDMSPAARRNAQRWLDSLWAGWREQVASQRGLDPQQLQDYADRFVQRLEATAGDLAAVAVQAGLVTAAEPLSAVRDAAKAVVGEDPEHGSFRQIWSQDYRRATQERGRILGSGQAQKRLAVVHVQGEIVDGDGGTGLAGGDLIRDLIHDARRDPDVAGLLLRVDSPGGSVNASEQIRQALLEFQASGRPVVASMASTAASGGYWVSMNADEIIAAPSTITGSIGVFGLVPTFAQAGNKLGLHADGVGTTQWAGALSPLRPLADNARATLDLVVGHDYRLFIQSVAQARDMTEAAVEDIASGQVWTGRQALEHGLVDGLGDEEKALQHLRELAGVAEDVPAEVFAPLPDPRFQWLQQLTSGWLASQLLPAMDLPWLAALPSQLGLPTLQPGERGTLAHCLCEPLGRRSH